MQPFAERAAEVGRRIPGGDFVEAVEDQDARVVARGVAEGVVERAQFVEVGRHAFFAAVPPGHLLDDVAQEEALAQTVFAVERGEEVIREGGGGSVDQGGHERRFAEAGRRGEHRIATGRILDAVHDPVEDRVAAGEETDAIGDQGGETFAQRGVECDRVVVDVAVDLHAGARADGDADALDGAGTDLVACGGALRGGGWVGVGRHTRTPR